MKPINGINPVEVPYFSLEEYVNKIKLNDRVLFHLEDTNVNFDEYASKLAQFNNEDILHYWIQGLAKELQYSTQMEDCHVIDPSEALKNDVYFNNLQMNHARIKQLHSFICSLDSNGTNVPSLYRQNGEEVRVSTMKNGEEIIFWRGAKAEDVKKFMDDFIKVYKSSSMSLINSNPFLKAALMSLLFVRIHPFRDGNGRTSRMIYNIKFTEILNRIYGTNLKLNPLNISQNIALYKPSYVSTINNIYFDLEHDSNDEINKWFDFILTRADEVMYYCGNKLEEDFEQLNKDIPVDGQASKMKLKRVLK